VSLPRALCGPVSAMARPARPPAEIAAVKAAAAIVRADTGATSNPAIAREIAARVVTALIADLERDPNDELAAAMAAVEQRLLPSPFVKLATCPDIDTASEYVKRRVARYEARATRYIAEKQDRAENAAIADQLMEAIARRYLEHLRCHDPAGM